MLSTHIHIIGQHTATAGARQANNSIALRDSNWCSGPCGTWCVQIGVNGFKGSTDCTTDEGEIGNHQ